MSGLQSEAFPLRQLGMAPDLGIEPSCYRLTACLRTLRIDGNGCAGLDRTIDAELFRLPLYH